MPQDHRNEDGSYTCYVRDTNGQTIPVTIPAGPIADGIDEYDRYMNNHNDYERQNRDMLHEYRMGQHYQGNPQFKENPLHQIADSNADVHTQAFGDGEKPERREIVETRRIVATLSEERQTFYDKRYEQDISQTELAEMEGKFRQSINRTDKKLQKQVRTELEKVGINDAFFSKHRR